MTPYRMRIHSQIKILSLWLSGTKSHPKHKRLALKGLGLFFLCPVIMSPLAFGVSPMGPDKEAILNMLEEHSVVILSFKDRFVGSKGHQETEKYIQHQLKTLIPKGDAQVFEFKTQTPSGKKTMRNYFLHLKGRKSQNQKNSSLSKTPDSLPPLIFAAHYDSKYFQSFSFVGANDNVSGVSVLLTLAYLSHQFPPPEDIGFLFLDGEEAFDSWSEDDSKYGSRYQSQLWEKQNRLGDIKSFILLDMVGHKDSVFCQDPKSSQELQNQLWAKAKELNFSFFQEDCATSVDDDHLPFLQKNVPAVDIIPTPFPQEWHTSQDNIEKLDYQRMSDILWLIFEFAQEWKR